MEGSEKMRKASEIKEEMRKVYRAMKMHEARLEKCRTRYNELQLELAEAQSKNNDKERK